MGIGRDGGSGGEESGVGLITGGDQGRVKRSKRSVDGPAPEGEEGESGGGGERKTRDGDKPRGRGGRRDRNRSRARS